MKQIIRQIWKNRNLLGITRVADNTRLDTLGFPVIVAVRPAVKLKQITTCQGKGLTFDEAMMGALCESVERHCASKINSR